MRFMDVVRGFFTKEREPINPSDYSFMCPRCGSTHIGYSSGCTNISDVVGKGELPKYGSHAECMECGFKTREYRGDSDTQSCLRELVRVKREDDRNTLNNG